MRFVGHAGDADDGAHVIGPFGIGEGRVRVEHLDHTGFVTRSPLGVPGCILVNRGCCLAHLFGALVQRGLSRQGRWTSMKRWMARYEFAPATIAKMANKTTCGRRYSLPSARRGSSISASRVRKGVNSMATSARPIRVAFQRFRDFVSLESYIAFPSTILPWVWHFRLTRTSSIER
jgi:hypothetical protein